MEALHRYEVLNSPPEQAFDDLTWLASKVAGTPIAVISLVDMDRLWFKSKVGLDADSAGRDVSFCSYAIQRDRPLLVTNALEDGRFRESPMVTGPLGVRFYLGIPLTVPDGHRLGTLCVIDSRPRSPDEEVVKMLSALARQVVNQLELRLSARKLKAAVTQAQQANEAKSNFLANMSHEIRTPLNGIIGMTDLLMDASEGSEQQQSLSIIKESGDTLLRLINDILDLSKVEAGKIQLESVNFDLQQRIDHIIQAFENAAREKGVGLNICLAEQLPRIVRGDPVRLDQVLGNLVSNAVKFTASGEVRVSVAPVVTDQAVTLFRFDIVDTGEGIPEEKLETIFEAFNQGDASTTRRYGGTGLGLAIVNHLVDLMGGAIEVQSKVGSGSVFSLTLPFRLPIEETSACAPVKHGQGAKGKLASRVLLVDDNHVNLLVADRMLRHLGHECVIAHGGKQAIEAFDEETFDFILMDIQMPDMNGFQTARAIRERERRNGREPTQIVAFTAHTMKGDRERCLEAGMTDFLAKPITLQALAKTIK